MVVCLCVCVCMQYESYPDSSPDRSGFEFSLDDTPHLRSDNDDDDDSNSSKVSLWSPFRVLHALQFLHTAAWWRSTLTSCPLAMNLTSLQVPCSFSLPIPCFFPFNCVFALISCLCLTLGVGLASFGVHFLFTGGAYFRMFLWPSSAVYTICYCVSGLFLVFPPSVPGTALSNQYISDFVLVYLVLVFILCLHSIKSSWFTLPE